MFNLKQVFAYEMIEVFQVVDCIFLQTGEDRNPNP